MKFRRTFRFHGLKRPRIRQTWNKYNLYNLYENFRFRKLMAATFFQQKWAAKAMTRGYHGEHIKERQWERMFSRRLASVVDMDPRYMAEFDGAEQAAGRGRGKQTEEEARTGRVGVLQPWAGTNRKTLAPTPYMQMTYAPMERRLDISIFRALFASSARQARQFVVHGAVTVNGKKMIYPGYLLNPGDMFQVDVDRVLFATGAKKRTRPDYVREGRHLKAKEEAEEAEEEEEGAKGEEDAAADEAHDKNREWALSVLPEHVQRIKSMLSYGQGGELSAKEKIRLRRNLKAARFLLSKANAETKAKLASKPLAKSAWQSDIVDELTALMADMPSPSKTSDSADAPAAITTTTTTTAGAADAKISEEERRRFHELLALDAENPIDRTKPYETPWRPKPYMRAFAFIPRYLEVNQNICAAVYLRHPVARPGASEIPSPFPPEINQLAFNWYLRRH